MRVAIASDHAGFEQKQQLVDYLASELKVDTIDCGPDTDDRVDYPDYAKKVADMVASGEADRGVLVCGTGIGMVPCASTFLRKVEIRSARFTGRPYPLLTAHAARL